jgi:hypothetical protein
MSVRKLVSFLCDPFPSIISEAKSEGERSKREGGETSAL